MNPKRWMRLALVLVLPSWAGHAEEGGSGHYAPGAAASAVDLLPGRPAFAYANLFTYYAGNAGVGRQFEFGGVLAANVEAKACVDTSFLLWQTPWQKWQVGYALGAAIPYAWVNVQATAEFTPPGGGSVLRRVNDWQSGLGDVELFPVMLVWTNGDFKVGGNLGLYVPTGSYEVGRLANTGKNYWTVEPALNFSWLSSKTGTEFTVFAGLDFNTANEDTEYQSGNSCHLDGTIAQHLPLLGGFVGVGANGFYYQQISADHGAGATLGDFEGMTAGVGPVVNWVRRIGGHDVFVEAKWLPELSTEKRTQGDYVWIKAGIAF